MLSNAFNVPVYHEFPQADQLYRSEVFRDYSSNLCSVAKVQQVVLKVSAVLSEYSVLVLRIPLGSGIRGGKERIRLNSKSFPSLYIGHNAINGFLRESYYLI